MGISKSLRNAIIKVFGHDEGNQLIKSTEEARFPLICDNFERVVYAILLGSKGNVGEFNKYLEHACIDWRDVLVATGLAHDDWKDILKKKGFMKNQS